jgi:hypothetical protein
MTSSHARKQLLFALRQVLRPIVRILIRAGTPTGSGSPFGQGVTRQRVDHYLDNEGGLRAAEPR